MTWNSFHRALVALFNAEIVRFVAKLYASLIPLPYLCGDGLDRGSYQGKSVNITLPMWG